MVARGVSGGGEVQRSHLVTGRGGGWGVREGFSEPFVGVDQAQKGGAGIRGEDNVMKAVGADVRESGGPEGNETGPVVGAGPRAAFLCPSPAQRANRFIPSGG